MCVIHQKLPLGVNSTGCRSRDKMGIVVQQLIIRGSYADYRNCYTGVKNRRRIPYLVSMGYLLCVPGI